MRVGILHEGDYDLEPLKEIVVRILGNSNHDEIREELFFKNYNAGGSTLAAFTKAYILFTEPPIKGDEPVDIMIQHADLDGRQDLRSQLSENKGRVEREGQLTPIVLAHPDPCLEQWFLAEADSIRHVFNILEGPLVTIGQHPKSCLKNLIQVSDKLPMTFSEIYAEIAKGLNLQKLARSDSNFSSFQNDLLTAVAQIKNT